MTSRSLDFLVIGAQKSGTTSLWHYLSPHPQLCLPRIKEAAFFTVSTDRDKLAQYMDVLFEDAPEDALLGTVTPDYMIGEADADVGMVAERIDSFLPGVKLVALLRDPIERAVSSYVMALRREEETRTVDAALGELLEPEELASARQRPTPTNTYLTAGEYGRILDVYRDRFPAERLLVVFSENLACDPGAVLDTTLGFLGLPTGFRPDDLDIRHFRSGTRKLLDGEAERRLFKFYDEQVLPYMEGSRRLNKGTFDFFYLTWNVAPDEHPPEPSAEVRARLEEHFRRDAEKLEGLGVQAPWVAHWNRQDP